MGLQTLQPLRQCLNAEEFMFVLKVSWVEGSNERLLKDLVACGVSHYFC